MPDAIVGGDYLAAILQMADFSEYLMIAWFLPDAVGDMPVPSGRHHVRMRIEDCRPIGLVVSANADRTEVRNYRNLLVQSVQYGQEHHKIRLS